ncbi:hypothetical protein M422DRAFT_773947 [Sphaerobolus stellatus SS14]|nr:hypothetical protein M422DRAFT_773947 [Sphaerobolus stellatus SS14]
MGQRHQAFLIARVVPLDGDRAQYRCVAALHHQWCYGTLPLRATSRFFKLVKQPQNAFIVREEISALHGKYAEYGDEATIPDVPAPYTMFLLESAFYLDLSDPKDFYSSQKNILEDSETSSDKPLPSLVEMSLKPAIISALENSQIEELDHIIWMPSNIQLIKKILRQDSSLREKADSLLSKIVEVELQMNIQTAIDFSGSALTSKQFIIILTPHPTISSLNLSNNPSVTVDTLTHLLTHLPNLRHIVLFNTGITRESLVDLLQTQPTLFYNLSMLIHPALINENDEELAWTAEYTHITQNYNGAVAVSLPIFTPTKSSSPLSTEILFQGMYATEFNNETQPWGADWDERVISICPQHSRLPAILRMHGWMFLLEVSSNSFAWVRFNTKAIESCKKIPTLKDGNEPERVIGRKEAANKRISAAKERINAAMEALGEKLFELYDLRGFLDACMDEGRPALTEEVAQNAIDTIEGLKNPPPYLEPSLENLPKYKVTLMTSANVLDFVKKEVERVVWSF